MPLLPEDAQYLDERNIAYSVLEEASMTCLVLPGWSLPAGLNESHTDVLIRLAVIPTDVVEGIR